MTAALARAGALGALARPFTLLAPAFGMVCGGLAALGAAPRADLGAGGAAEAALRLAAGAAMAAALNAASNALNQIFDLEIDRVNKPERPLPAGALSVAEAAAFSAAAYALALGLAALLGRATFGLVLAAALATVAYSAPPARTKRHWLAAQITIAVPRGTLLWVAGWSTMKPVDAPEPWLLGAVFGGFILGAAATKDFSDMAGDRLGGCETMPIRFGVRRAARLIAPFFVLPFLILPAGVLAGAFSARPAPLALLGAALALGGARVAAMLLADPERLSSEGENHPAWRGMYGLMLAAQGGVALAYLL